MVNVVMQLAINDIKVDVIMRLRLIKTVVFDTAVTVHNGKVSLW